MESLLQTWSDVAWVSSSPHFDPPLTPGYRLGPMLHWLLPHLRFGLLVRPDYPTFGLWDGSYLRPPSPSASYDTWIDSCLCGRLGLKGLRIT